MESASFVLLSSLLRTILEEEILIMEIETTKGTIDNRRRIAKMLMPCCFGYIAFGYFLCLLPPAALRRVVLLLGSVVCGGEETSVCIVRFELGAFIEHRPFCFHHETITIVPYCEDKIHKK